MRAKTINLLGEIRGQKLRDTGFQNGLILTYDTKSMNNKRKKELDIIKIFNFCTPQDIIKKVKRQHIEREKIFANHMRV